MEHKIYLQSTRQKSFKALLEARSKTVNTLLILPEKISCKSEHASKVLDSFKKMRTEKFGCDFTIKVCGQRFPVHRSMLSACSDYFRAMFSHPTKESEEGEVDMKDVEPDAVKKCIDFMYTGETSFEMEKAQELLHVSSLLQLNDLVEVLFKHLEKSLDLENCFIILEYAKTFSHDAVIESAERFILENLAKVIATKGFGKLSIGSISRLMLRSSGTSSTTQWLAVTTWIKSNQEQRKKHLLKLVKYINFSTYPFNELLKNVWSDPLIQEFDNAKQLVIVGLFNNAQKLEDNLDFKNCFVLKDILKECGEKFHGTLLRVYDFMVKNFFSISKLEEFKLLSDDDMLTVYGNVDSHALAKWDAALLWVKHSLKNREKSFPRLLKSINLDELTVHFIENTISAEPLVRESHECKDFIISVLCKKISRKTNREGFGSLEAKTKPTTHVASYILLLDKKNKNIRGFDPQSQTWTNIASADHISNTSYAAITWVRQTLFLLHNRSLYSLNANHRWVELPEMSFRPDKTTRVIAFDNCVYVVCSNYVAFYDPAKSDWIYYGQPDSFQSGGFCLASTEKNLYAFGGYPCSDRSQKYDPAKIAWTVMAPMKHQRCMAAATTHKEFIFVMGGRRNELSLLNSVERYDPSANSWTEIRSMNMPRCNFCSCDLNGNLFAIGGQDSIEQYDDEKRTWSMVGVINSRPFGISSCAYQCWKVRTVKDGKVTDTIMPM